MQRLCEVTDSLLISNARLARSPELVRRGAPTLCINVTQRQPFPDVAVVGRAVRVAVRDRPDEDLYRHFDACADAIHREAQNGGRTLVYCKNGRSRSAAVCAAYLVKYRQVALTDALKTVAAARPQAAPNRGFVAQLQRYEDELRGRRRRESPWSRGSPESPDPVIKSGGHATTSAMLRGATASCRDAGRDP
ncbi:dual specificity phosphatase 28 isoform X2 [Syngnathoides biaculeatus]|uniref:dual specificity phosphatase 28 isoform X2 n=1 Tax=Syngnathoides biaculeatus TaxID=300417 RepID=UPI002ADE1EB5|nr:dual specificity phosphatase 28 isoform X2 [Syngnathoides biaculeatus]